MRYLRAGGLPFHLGWWAFTFPLGAFAVATLNIARAWDVPVRTAAATLTGRIWLR